MEGTRVVARHFAVVAACPRAIAGVEALIPRAGAREAHRRRATLHEVVAEFLAGEHFLIRTRLDDGVDQGVPAGLVAQLVREMGVLGHEIRR